MNDAVNDAGPPRRPRSKLRRALLWVGASLGVLLLLLVGTAVGFYVHFNGQLKRVHGVITPVTPTRNVAAPQAASSTTPQPVPAPAANYLLVGADVRDSQTRHIPHTGGQACNCSDTIIVAHVPAGHTRAILVSIPRDSWVDIPAYTAPNGQTTPEHYAKINSALATGGPGLLVKVVQQLTGLHIDHYVQVNFAGFVDMVNAVNGVDVCLLHDEQDSYSGIDMTAGVHHVDGIQALEYVRQRHGLPNGDLDRIKRQQAVIEQVIHKVLNAGILLHPGQLTSFLDVVTKSVTVDDKLGIGDMEHLASTFSHFDASHVEFATAPIITEGAWRDGQSVVLLDSARMTQMFAAVALGSLPRDTASPTPRPTTASPAATGSSPTPTPTHTGPRCLP